MSDAAGIVADIQRGCAHDGPGIRTVVFLKGCPLRCDWCHNPEMQRPGPEVMYNPILCQLCGRCAEVCLQGGHRFDHDVHRVDHDPCIGCLACADACLPGALEGVGRPWTVADVMDVVRRDRVFYEVSGGGLTLSGGEPTAQFRFARALLEAARAEGIHTCLETCGYGPTERFLELVPLVDLFLWDIKDTDPERHYRYVGETPEPILENLRTVDAAGGQTRLRSVMLANVNLNREHLRRMARLRRSLIHCEGIDLLPYHPLGHAKLEKLGAPRPADPARIPTRAQMAEATRLLAE